MYSRRLRVVLPPWTTYLDLKIPPTSAFDDLVTNSKILNGLSDDCAMIIMTVVFVRIRIRQGAFEEV
jgi:hypothetical protein